MIGDIIQPTHLLFILVVALLVLGPKRLPEVGRSLGRGIRDFRQGMQGMEAEARGVFSSALDEPAKPASEQPAADESQPSSPPVAETVASDPPASSVAPVPSRVSAPSAAPTPGPAPSATAVATEPDPADYAD